MNTHIQLSIVIPVYNSAEIFPELYLRLSAAMHDCTYRYEIIAIIDGCKDNSFEVISAFQLHDNRLKLVEFSRNFGHQAAISAGLQVASGDMVAVMDDDLEDPPEILLKMIAKIEDGYDVVYGVRKKRKRSFFHRILYRQFYRVMGALVDTHMPYDAGDFCIMKRRVVDALNSMQERNIYIRGLRAWSGFRQTGIEYDRGARFSSGSGYNLKKYIALALDAIFSFSYKPLKYVSRAGMLIAIASFIIAARIVIYKLSGETI
jgi:polyisoprenyl-phosphate glycosyltransferase